MDADFDMQGPSRAAASSLGPHTAAETAMARHAALVELHMQQQQRQAAVQPQLVEPLAGHQRYRKLKTVQR